MKNSSKNFEKIKENLVSTYRNILQNPILQIDYDENLINKVDMILNNYEEYSCVRKNTHQVSDNYTWDIWVKNIIKEYGKEFFNPKSYKEIYTFSFTDESAVSFHYEFWY